MEFPDTKRGVRSILAQFGKTYLQLTADYNQHLPGILVYRVGGSETGPFRTDRITVEVYDRNTTSVDDLTQEVNSFLTSGPHDTGEYGLIDRIEVETVFINIPQPENWPAMSQAVYRVSVRGI